MFSVLQVHAYVSQVELAQDFAALAEEAGLFAPDWAIVFVAALSGRGGQPPADTDIGRALDRMVEAIKAGRLDGLMPVDRRGRAVRLA